MNYDKECVGCSIDGITASLERCRMCSKYYCPGCAQRVRGAIFCSTACGGLFAWGDGDEDLDEDSEN